MTASGLKKIPMERASQVCRDIALDPDALALLSPDMAPADYLHQLVARSLFADAVKFLARALPKRESTWWACLCARAALGTPPPAPLREAIEAAERWVYEPSEAHRRATQTAAQTAGFAAAAGWAAMAAFWSGGSMVPPDLPAVPPPDDLTAKAAAGAVMLAAVCGEPARAPERYRDFLRRGLDIAGGGDGRLG